MPHLRSVASKALRTRRALYLGYAPSCNAHMEVIQVPSPIAKATRAAAASLAVHLKHDCLTEETNHHGRLASLHAMQRGHIDLEESKMAMATHKDSGKQKHNVSADKGRRALWADLEDFSECLLPPPPPPFPPFLPPSPPPTSDSAPSPTMA